MMIVDDSSHVVDDIVDIVNDCIHVVDDSVRIFDDSVSIFEDSAVIFFSLFCKCSTFLLLLLVTSTIPSILLIPPLN